MALLLEAFTVCINYSDFLSETIRFNLPLFDRWVVITRESDERTRDLCRKYSLECVLSDEGHREDTFNKGWLVERVLRHASAKGWRLHLDADIVLPTQTRILLEAADLDTKKVYGIDRILVKGWEEWQKLQQTGYLLNQHSHHNLLRFPDGYAVGSRWCDHSSGYCPIGFFQLFHSDRDQYKGTRSLPYPSQHNSACRSDVQFSHLFDRRQRELLPELIAVHLESESAKLGANWQGRTTKRFGSDSNYSSNKAESSVS